LLKRLSPFILTFIAVILDTSVLPVFYSGILTVPLTLMVVFCIGILLGRMNGLLYGMIGGLLIDVTTGTLGLMTFFFMACGFLSDLILNEAGSMAASRLHWRVLYTKRALCIAALYGLGEIVLLVYQYFNTALFDWLYVRNLLIRTVLFTALNLLLCPYCTRRFFGKKQKAHAQNQSGKFREVKHF